MLSRAAGEHERRTLWSLQQDRIECEWRWKHEQTDGSWWGWLRWLPNMWGNFSGVLNVRTGDMADEVLQGGVMSSLLFSHVGYCACCLSTTNHVIPAPLPSVRIGNSNTLWSWQVSFPLQPAVIGAFFVLFFCPDLADPPAPPFCWFCWCLVPFSLHLFHLYKSLTSLFVCGRIKFLPPASLFTSVYFPL